MTDALRLAVGTLTRLPIRPPRTLDRNVAGQAIILAPLTAVAPSLLLVLLHLVVANAWLPAYVAATLVLAATAWWSRGLHLDGLADTADGLASGYDRERALDVMRRGDIGPTGVVTLVLVLLLQVTALGPLLTSRPGAVLAAVALLASRQVLVLGCRHGVPAARSEGLGATVAGSVPTAAAVASTAVMVVVGSGLAWLAGAAWYAGALVSGTAVIATSVVVATAQRRVGGVTGDVLGAVVETALSAGLLVAVVTPVAAG